MLLDEVRRLLEARRRPETAEGAGASKECAREARKALRGLKRKVSEASGRGRWLRARIGRMFDIAAALGPETLMDYLDHAPWEATGHPGGRPRKVADLMSPWVRRGGTGRGFCE